MTWKHRLSYLELPLIAMFAFLAGLMMAPNSIPLLTPSSNGQTASLQSPQFKTHDCLALKDAEAWDREVWAEVLQVGKKAYLLDTQPYKRRSKFADIAATPLDFALVEATMEKTECPERVWIQQGLPHENKGTWLAWSSR